MPGCGSLWRAALRRRNHWMCETIRRSALAPSPRRHKVQGEQQSGQSNSLLSRAQCCRAQTIACEAGRTGLVLSIHFHDFVLPDTEEHNSQRIYLQDREFSIVEFECPF